MTAAAAIDDNAIFTPEPEPVSQPGSPLLLLLDRIQREHATCMREASEQHRRAVYAETYEDDHDEADDCYEAEQYWKVRASALRWVEAQMRECGVLP